MQRDGVSEFLVDLPNIDGSLFQPPSMAALFSPQRATCA